MAIKLSSQDQEFRNPLLFHGDAKNIDLDRVLLNLFMLLKFNGVRPRARVGRQEVKPETFVKRLVDSEQEGFVENFEGNEEKILGWVMTNLSDMVSRGVPGKEALASLKAIHLNSYRFRNPKHVRDYNFSDQVFAMLQEEPKLIVSLRNFLSEGWDQGSDQLTQSQTLDLDTLGILRIVEKDKDEPSGDVRVRPARCVCPGGARIFADDVRKILQYRDNIPRHVLLEYLKTLMGVHVGLYLFKLYKMLPDWVEQGERHPVCKECPVFADKDDPYEGCPYKQEFVVDCGDNPDSNVAKIAEEDAQFYYARTHDYIRATFAINMALQTCDLTDKKNTEDIDQALAKIRNRDQEFNIRFKLRQEDLIGSLDEDQRSIFQPVLDMGLPEFETFIELVMLARSSFHFNYHRELLDRLFQRNMERGLIWAGRTKKHGRRFWMSSRLLETLVQLAVLKTKKKSDGTVRNYSEPILIEEFLDWLKNRYGIIVNGIDMDQFSDADVETHQAFKENITEIKRRLREIGFFNVLSDAYIMQKIRPRYEVEAKV